MVIHAHAPFASASLARGSDAAGDTIDRRNAFLIEPEAEALTTLIRELTGSRRMVEEVGMRARDEVYRSWSEIVAEVQQRYAIALAALQGVTPATV